MNPQHLIRSAVATLAAATFLVAQSAPLAPATPVAPGASAAPKASAVSTERLQVRLAEVIAMLEEDDLTAEQRAQAKKKLEEISVRLRAASKPAEAPKAVAGKALAERDLAVMVDAAKAAESPARVRVVRQNAEGGESVQEVAVAPVATAGPTPPRVVRGPRAPRAPDMAAAPKVVEVAPAQDPQPFARARAAQSQAAQELRAAAEKLRTEVKAADGAKARIRFAEVAEQNEKQAAESQAKALLFQAREGQRKAAVEVERADLRRARSLVMTPESDKSPASAVEPMVLRLMDDAVAARKPSVARRVTAAPKDFVLELDDVKKAKVDSAKAKMFAPRVRAEAGVSNDDGDDDDDRKILKLLAQMRAEMREIKAMLQELKQQQAQQAQPARTRVRSLGGGMSGSGGSTFGSGSGGKATSGNLLFGAGAGQSGNGDVYFLETPAKGEEGGMFFRGTPAQTGSGSAKTSYGWRKAKPDDDDDDTEEVKVIEVRAANDKAPGVPPQSIVRRSPLFRSVAPARAGGRENQMR